MADDTPHKHTAHHVRFPHVKFPHIHFTHKELHDRPLAGEPHPDHPLHWKLYICEGIATCFMMILGVGAVVLLQAGHSPVARFLQNYPALQIALCGLCFGLAGTAAAMTRFGKVSGAHLNPSVTLGFTLSGKMCWTDAVGYFIAQCVGAIWGTIFITILGKFFPFWHVVSHEAHFAATYPTPRLSQSMVMVTEVLATFGIIYLIFCMAAHPRLQRWTPWLGGLYYFLLNPFEAWASGDSTNFARSLGPALIDGNLVGLWVYLIGPFVGASLAVLLVRSNLLGRIHLREARIINFGHYGRVPRLKTPEAVGPSPERVARKGDDAAQV